MFFLHVFIFMSGHLFFLVKKCMFMISDVKCFVCDFWINQSMCSLHRDFVLLIPLACFSKCQTNTKNRKLRIKQQRKLSLDILQTYFSFSCQQVRCMFVFVCMYQLNIPVFSDMFHTKPHIAYLEFQYPQLSYSRRTCPEFGHARPLRTNKNQVDFQAAFFPAMCFSLLCFESSDHHSTGRWWMAALCQSPQYHLVHRMQDLEVAVPTTSKFV